MAAPPIDQGPASWSPTRKALQREGAIPVRGGRPLLPETTLVFRVHALERMFQRGITPEDVREVLKAGATIESYPDDRPYPSRLVLGWRDERPLHVVVADDDEGDRTIVISAYEPEPDRWDDRFERRTEP